MLKVYSRNYDEDSSQVGFHSYETALESIANEINQTCLSYTILNVDHTRTTEYGTDSGCSRSFLMYPFGTVTVLADVITKASGEDSFLEKLKMK